MLPRPETAYIAFYELKLILKEINSHQLLYIEIYVTSFNLEQLTLHIFYTLLHFYKTLQSKQLSLLYLISCSLAMINFILSLPTHHLVFESCPIFLSSRMYLVLC